MYAIVEACGRQYQLEAGRFVDVDLIACEPGQDYVFDRVLMIVDGKESHLGGPLLEGAKVTGQVLAHSRDKKIIVYKQKPKKGTRKKQGHRQGFTRILIGKIELKDKVLAEAKKAERAGKAEPAKAAKAKQATAKTDAQPAKKEESASKGKSKAKHKEA
jgi:large subunit ribosomal protein L21